MPTTVVPSDITLAERRACIGLQTPSLLERYCLLFNMPVYHFSYTKNGPTDKYNVLSKVYPDGNADPIHDIVRTRQDAIRREVYSKPFGFWFASIGGSLTYWSMRKYCYQARLLTIPTVAYLSSFAGRMFGDIITGRTGEYRRDRYLASLPANVRLE